MSHSEALLNSVRESSECPFEGTSFSCTKDDEEDIYEPNKDWCSSCIDAQIKDLILNAAKEIEG